MSSVQHASARTQCRWVADTVTALQKLVEADPARMRAVMARRMQIVTIVHPPWPLTLQRLRAFPMMRQPTFLRARQALEALDAAIRGAPAQPRPLGAVAPQSESSAADAATASASADAAAAELLQVYEAHALKHQLLQPNMHPDLTCSQRNFP